MTARARILALLAAAAGAVAAVLLAAPGAAAAPGLALHAVLLSSDPLEGAEVSSPPAAVTLTFGEPVTAAGDSLTVMGPRGDRVDAGPLTHPGGDRAVISRPLPAGLPKGSYTVVWRVVSADSHPVSGTFSFGVGVPAGAAVAAPTGSAGVGFLNGTARFAGFAGLALGAGAVAFGWIAGEPAWRRPGVRRAATAGAVLLGVSAVALFLVAGPYDAGDGWGRLFSGPLLDRTFHTRYGKLVAVRVLVAAALVAVLVASRRRPRPGLAVVVPLAVGVLTFSLSQHAGTGRQAPFSAVVDAAHLAAVCVWVGGTVALVVVLARQHGAGGVLPPAALRRWSAAAGAAVACIVVTGGYAVWREVGTLPALPGTPYGRLVLAKAGALSALLVLGAVARRAVRDRAAGIRLPWVLAGETAVMAGVLVVTAILVDVRPGRDAYDPPATLRVAAVLPGAADLAARVEVASTRPGRTLLTVRVRDDNGRPVAFQAVSGLLTEKATGLGPVRFVIPASAGGSGRASVVVPARGRWDLELQVRLDDFRSYAAAASYRVR